MWRWRLEVLLVLLEDNWTWVLLHPRTIEIKTSFSLWHFSHFPSSLILYRWLNCSLVLYKRGGKVASGSDERYLGPCSHPGRAGSELWRVNHGRWECELWNVDLRNIFIIFFNVKTERVYWLKLCEETIWNTLRVVFWFPVPCCPFPFSFYLFIFFLDITPTFLFSLPKSKCCWNCNLKPCICRNTKNYKRIATMNGLTLE